MHVMILWSAITELSRLKSRESKSNEQALYYNVLLRQMERFDFVRHKCILGSLVGMQWLLLTLVFTFQIMLFYLMHSCNWLTHSPLILVSKTIDLRKYCNNVVHYMKNDHLHHQPSIVCFCTWWCPILFNSFLFFLPDNVMFARGLVLRTWSFNKMFIIVVAADSQDTVNLCWSKTKYSYTLINIDDNYMRSMGTSWWILLTSAQIHNPKQNAYDYPQRAAAEAEAVKDSRTAIAQMLTINNPNSTSNCHCSMGYKTASGWSQELNQNRKIFSNGWSQKNTGVTVRRVKPDARSRLHNKTTCDGTSVICNVYIGGSNSRPTDQPKRRT